MKTSTHVSVAIYARVSTEQQAERQTIASQVAALRQRVAEDGFVLDDALCFTDDGYSGMTLARPALERLRDRAATGDIDRLYVLEPDRLARRYAYVALLTEELQQAGVEVVFLHGSLGQSAEDKLLAQVQGMLAEYERVKLLDRCRRGRRHAAHSGSVTPMGRAPYGYRYVRDTLGRSAHYEVEPTEAEVVRRIFSWLTQERLSLQAVSRRLEAEGTPTRSGRAWSRQGVYAIVKNPAYQGLAEYGKTRVGPRRPRLRAGRNRPEQPRRAFSIYRTEAAERIKIPVPAVIGPELFAAVQDQLQENQKRYRERCRGASYLLQGLLVCRECGYAVCGKRKRNRIPARADRPARQHVYYGCLGNPALHRSQPPCRLPLLWAEVLERTVWQDVQALLADPDQVAREYQRRLRASPVRARPPGTTRRLGQWARRRPWTVVIGAASIALVGLCLVFGLWAALRERDWTILYLETQAAMRSLPPEAEDHSADVQRAWDMLRQLDRLRPDSRTYQLALQLLQAEGHGGRRIFPTAASGRLAAQSAVMDSSGRFLATRCSG